MQGTAAVPLISLVVLVLWSTTSAFLQSTIVVPHHMSPGQQHATVARQPTSISSPAATMSRPRYQRTHHGAHTTTTSVASQSSDRFARDRVRTRDGDVRHLSMSADVGPDVTDNSGFATEPATPSRSDSEEVVVPATVRAGQPRADTDVSIDASVAAPAAEGVAAAICVEAEGGELDGAIVGAREGRDGARMTGASRAPDRTEIPTDVAVVGAPQTKVCTSDAM